MRWLQENQVIRLRLSELLADASFRAGRRVELLEVAQATGIHRTTLSKMINVRGYNATLSNVDALCRFFGCGVAEIAVYVPDEEVPAAGPSAKAAKADACSGSGPQATGRPGAAAPLKRAAKGA